jgi:hypothetical protein
MEVRVPLVCFKRFASDKIIGLSVMLQKLGATCNAKRCIQLYCTETPLS